MILFWLSGGFILGILLGGWWGAAGVLYLLPAGALFLGAWIIRLGRWWSALLFLAILLLGVARAPHAGTPVPGDLNYYNGRHLQVQGIVSAEPDIRDTGANYVVSVDHVLIGSRLLAVSGQVQVHTPAAIQLDFGDRVTLIGNLLTPVNTSTLPWKNILAQRGIGSEMQFPRVTDLGYSASGPAAWIQSLRQTLENGINRWLPEPEAALLIAITLGAKSASLGDLVPALVATGLIHLIAISGIKVAVVAGTVNELVKRAGNRLITLATSQVAIWLYVLLTGGTPSGVRSAVMWSLVFIAGYLGRGTVALVSLGFAAAVMVGLDPGLLEDIGFQLSVVATFAIVAFAPVVMRVVNPVPSPWREALGVTVAAQVGTVPIVVIGFHLLSLSGPLANLLVLPLLPLLIVLGFLVGLLAGVPVLASPLAALSYALLHAIVVGARALATWPLDLPATAISLGVTLAYYAALGAVAYVVLRYLRWSSLSQRGGRSREFGFAGVLGAGLLTFSLVGSNTPPDSLTWLGSGNSMLLQSGSQSALIDASSHPFALLERLGALLPSDRRRIDVVIVTDPRGNNVLGLGSILQHYELGEVIDVGVEYPSTSYARWRAMLRQRHIPAYALRTGALVTLGDAAITALGPDALYSNPRDSAGLLRVVIPGDSVLLAGTASVREQHEAVFRPVNLGATVLVAPGPLDPEFRQAVHPVRIWRPSTTEETTIVGSR